MTTPLTIGDVARLFDVAPWQVRRLFERALVPQARRVGAYRIIDPADLPTIEGALREAGYLSNASPKSADGRGVAR
jgi:DNA-binding transcriptional MerR regulator